MSAGFLERRMPSRNDRMAIGLLMVVALMVGASYAAVPLYQIFCQVTGFGGTTQRAQANTHGVIEREVAVRFDANVAAGLSWRVEPAERVTQRIGEVEVIAYRATNLSDHAVTGTAGFNVTPERIGLYFNKIECFCFTEQTLEPGETVEMPVTFFVDPELDADSELDTLREITLSYTFYPVDIEGS